MTSIVVNPAFADTVATGRRILAALRDLDRRRWEAQWHDLTGRPWGWQPPAAPRISVHLGTERHGADARVALDDLPFHAIVSGITIDRLPSDRGPGSLVLTIPMMFVDLT